MKRSEQCIVLFSVTLALLVNEIMLSSVFHVIIGQFNTIIAISTALLGLSMSGIVVFLNPKLRQANIASKTYYMILFWFVVSTILTTIVIMSIPINHGDLSYVNEPKYNLLKIIIYLVAIIPFFLGGIFINLILFSGSRNISQLYFSDLTGAAFGCMISPFLMEFFGAPHAIIYATIPCATLICFFALREKKHYSYFLLLPCFFFLIVMVSNYSSILDIKRLNTMGKVDSPEYKGFPVRKGDIKFEKWAVDAWTIIRDDKIPQQWEDFKGWGLSDNYRGKVPKAKLINYNSRFSTYVTEFDGNIKEISDYLDSDVISLHYLLGRYYPKVLNIGAGGGREVLNAINHNALEVTAVDISKVVVNDIMKNYLKKFSGELYFNPKVTALADEGRSFIERHNGKYDLIDFSIVGGMNLEKMDILNADNLFTVEGFRTYIDHLEDQGVFSYVMYNLNSGIISDIINTDYFNTLPYIPAVKTLVGLKIVFEEKFPDVKFEDHVLIAGLHGVMDKRYDLVHIIMSKAPFSKAERERFINKCLSLNFVIFYPVNDQASNVYSQIIKEPDLTSFSRLLPFDIYPPTDDKPFLYSFSWRSLNTIISSGSFYKIIMGHPLVSTGIKFIIISVLFLVVPLLWHKHQGEYSLNINKVWYMLFFFASIGSGYMLIEMSVILKLQMYLGKPVYALSVALFTFLLSSGMGSYFTGRFRQTKSYTLFYLAILGLVSFGLAFHLYWSYIFSNSIYLPSIFRIIIAVAVVFPLAFFMGMFFPIGIKIISGINKDMIPWVWAINGCSSVLGIFLGRIAALFVGFNAVLLLGLFVYIIMAVLIVFFKNTIMEVLAYE